MEYVDWEKALTILGPAAAAVSEEEFGLFSQSTLSDPWLIAAEIADLLAVRALGAGGVTEFSAEGATFKKSQADWEKLAATLRAKAGVTDGSDGFAFVVTGAPPRRPELSGGWPCY